MLKVEHLTKKYQKVLANDDLSFDVNKNQITVLLGPNGAGKSTAIKAMAGLLRYSGSITIDGFNNKSIDAKRLIGYIPETPSVYPLLTVTEHLEFIARAHGLSNYDDRMRYLMDSFELSANAQKVGSELSKGMQQKVSVCCALLTEPSFLLVDEPMVGLDPHAIKTLKKVLIEEKERGAAILISTHLIESVEDIWDSVLILQNGKIVAGRNRRDIENSGEKLSELFFSITEGA